MATIIAIQAVQKLEPDSGQAGKYVDFIDIYAGLTDNQLQQWQQQYRGGKVLP